MSTPRVPQNELDAIEHQAAAWVLRRDRGLTAPEQDEFSQWLAGDPRRRACLARHCRNWDRLDQLADWRREHSPLPNPDLLAPPARRLVRFWTVAPILALGAAALVIFAVLLQAPDGSASKAPVPASALAMIEERMLEDGSRVELNRGAEISVQFSQSERRVRLEKGEAHFTVTKNPARPFIVSAGKVDVRAVGTAFNVLLRQEGVEVLVTEGQVAVVAEDGGRRSDDGGRRTEARGRRSEVGGQTTEDGGQRAEGGGQGIEDVGRRPGDGRRRFEEGALLVDAGQRATVPLASPEGQTMPRPQVSPVSAEERDQLLAWQPRLLDFTASPLSAIVVEFNERNPVQIVVGEPSLRFLRISASFRSDNIEGFVRLLEATFGVRAERNGLTITLFKKGEM